MALIRSVRFARFRTLRDVTVVFQPRTVLVGSNNVGKTSVLEALEGAFGIGRRGYGFSEQDTTSGEDPSIGFEIVVEVVPSQGDQFSEDEQAIFATHIDLSQQRQRLLVRVVGRVEPEDDVFRAYVDFIKADGLDDGRVSQTQRRALTVVMLPATRDARRELGDRTGLWGRLTSDVDVARDVEERIEQLGREFGRTVVDELLGEELRVRLTDRVAGSVADVLYADEPGSGLEFSLTPLDAQQALRQVELRLTTPGQPESRRVVDHSLGTQSVALYGLFEAYLESAGMRALAVAVEEPEAHLHPHAVRGLVKRIRRSPFQTIVSTHSTAVTNEADPREIVLLRRRASGTVASAVPPGFLSEDEVRVIRRYISEVGSDFLFSRAILFAEGQSEHLALPIFAAQLDIDFDQLGISVVPVSGSHFQRFAKLVGPQALTIPHVVICDRDAARQLLIDLRGLNRLPTGTDPDDLDRSQAAAAAAGYFWWSAGTFEQSLLEAGGAAHFVTALIEQRGRRFLEDVAAKIGTSDLADPRVVDAALRGKTRKPQINQRVAELFSGTAVPTEIVAALRALEARARAEAHAVASVGAGNTVGRTAEEE
ncbi:MAG TPA: AAA family ATPase [Vicinamibacterales bacterium]|nr:AAA family ATPase [Vicinamibacterales bacterium]